MKKIILLLAVAISFCSTNIANAQTKNSKIKIFNEADFNKNISSGLILVDFYADWCGPCRMMQPILEDAAKEYEGKMVVAKVNTDQNKQLAAIYKITGIPCMILFKDGKEIKRIIGYKTKELLTSELSEYLK